MSPSVLGRKVARLVGREETARRRQAARVPLIERGRFDVCVMAILKNEARHIEEWLCHHLAIGVDHFLLYDNGSTDDLHDVLKPYADHGIVTTVYFPMRGLQRDANNHAVRFFGSTTEWLAYVDIDEFLVPERDEQIGEILARLPTAEQVLVSRKEFCYGGHRTPPEGLVTESYRYASRDVPRVGTSAVLAKPIIRPAAVMRVGIHNAATVHGRTVNTAGTPTSERSTVIEDPSYANLQMNHYYTKSWEEFQAKRRRATTSTHAFVLPDVPFDIPSEEDHAIDRWLPRTKAVMQEMRALPRSPSRYGSRLRLEGFPAADMFGQEAAAVVTNEAAGLDEARKKRAAPSLLIGGVRGAMVRAEDFGYEPRQGGFLASPHVAQEVAWLQAEVSWAAPGGTPPLQVEGGTVRAGGDVPTVELDPAGGRLVIPAVGPPWRCHAILFTLRVEVAAKGADEPSVSVVLGALEDDRWVELPEFRMPGSGTYLGLMSLDKRPRTIEEARMSFEGARAIGILDLALLSFG